jgi:hypothetical protein
MTVWTAHLKAEAKPSFESAVINTMESPVWHRLIDIIKQELSSLEASTTNEAEYDNSSWAFKQAHKNGKRDALTTILKLMQR